MSFPCFIKLWMHLRCRECYQNAEVALCYASRTSYFFLYSHKVSTGRIDNEKGLTETGISFNPIYTRTESAFIEY